MDRAADMVHSGAASTRIVVSSTQSLGGFSAGLRLAAGIRLFLNHLCLLVSCPYFLLPLSLWVLQSSPR